MSDYDPVKTLQAEVNRFKATNRFTPMEVTGFYIHAAVVLDELKSIKEAVDASGTAIGNEHVEYSTVERIHNITQQRDYFMRELDKLREAK